MKKSKMYTSTLYCLILVIILMIISISRIDVLSINPKRIMFIYGDLIQIVICTLLIYCIDQAYDKDQPINFCLFGFSTVLASYYINNFINCLLFDRLSTNIIYFQYSFEFIVVIAILFWYWKLIVYLLSEYDIHLVQVNRIQTTITILSVLNIIVNLFTHHIFTLSDTNEYMMCKTYPISYIGPFLMFFICSIVIIKNKIDMDMKKRLMFYMILPLFVSGLVLLGSSESLLYTAILSEVLLIYMNLYLQRGKRLLEIQAELLKKDAKVKDYQEKIMISQIQPHFIYNVLGSISMLYKTDPKKAAEATDQFAKYLRANINTINSQEYVSFKKELEHIKYYIYLEKMRFEDLEFDMHQIENDDFLVPSLSIQPLVENAVKHGIMGKESGGRICIKEVELNSYHVIKVWDNGIGFDVKLQEDKFTGINNVRYRIEELLGGTLTITSIPGEGTVITIFIPKKEAQEVE